MTEDTQHERYLKPGVSQYETDLELHHKQRADGYGGEPTLVPLNQEPLGGSGYDQVTPAGQEALVGAFRREYWVEEAEHPFRAVHERLAIEPGWEYDPDDWHTRYQKLPVGKALFEPDHVAVYSITYTDQEIEPMHDPGTLGKSVRKAFDRSDADDNPR